MSGRVIEITSGQEDLSSQGVMDLLNLPVDQLPEEASEALLSLSGANALGQGEIDVSTEDLKIESSGVVAEGECKCESAKRPPLCSKVMNKDGSAVITILYDGSAMTGGDNLSMFTGLINAAVESDVIDLTIMTCFNNFSRSSNDTIKVLALINALKRCKAKKIITRAGCLGTLGDCVLWLSGNDRRIGPMTWLMVKPYKTGGEASVRDMEDRANVMRTQIELFGNICVEKGLLTEDEVKRLYEDECSISISFDELQARVDALKD